ncbi:hypothetical protein IWW36_003253 [Coemansia brasiliensis]|uniref:DUF21-domain-containing protein n=1 Tax=Coemansia brasiliensis TaxID=2650707 RepID=A0A9W8I6P7_9FUNG|nr:hypothetical protein IWW36_003253 [Coemansia brasiliensis]
MDPPIRSRVQTAAILSFVALADAHPIEEPTLNAAAVAQIQWASTSYSVKLLACMVLVLVGGLLAGLTLGLMSLDATNLHILATSGTEKQRVYAKRIQPLRQNGHWLLVTLLLGNTIVNETLPIVLDSVLGSGGVSAIIISTASIVLFGEIIPQSLCARYGLAIGAFFVYPVRALQYLLAPLGYPIAKLLDYTLGSDHGVIYKKAQLKELVSLSDAAHGGNLSADEVTIIRGALELSEKLVSDVMTDLDNVFMVDIDAQLDRKLLTEMVQRGHSRVPVYEGHRCNIVGLLLVKSLVLLDPDDAVPVREAKITSIPQITPDVSLYDILNAFQEGGSHLAVVMGLPPHSSGQMLLAANKAHCTTPADDRTGDGASQSVASSNSSTLATRMNENAPLLSPAHVSSYIADNPAPYHINALVPIGIITLEDVIEELIQEEIIDETDEFIDIRRRIRVVRKGPELSTDAGAAVLVPRSVSAKRSAPPPSPQVTVDADGSTVIYSPAHDRQRLRQVRGLGFSSRKHTGKQEGR